MAGLLLPPDLAKRLREMRAEQDAKRAVENNLGKFEVGELAALQKLAWDLFGDRGVVEFRPSNPGIAYVGRAHQRKLSQGAHRYRPANWLFSGASIEEISRQVKLWRSRQ